MEGLVQLGAHMHTWRFFWNMMELGVGREVGWGPALPLHHFLDKT